MNALSNLFNKTPRGWSVTAESDATGKQSMTWTHDGPIALCVRATAQGVEVRLDNADYDKVPTFTTRREIFRRMARNTFDGTTEPHVNAVLWLGWRAHKQIAGFDWHKHIAQPPARWA